jgi:hypothetical protein
MLRSIAACALAGAVAVNAIATISVKGSKFFTSDGDQFYVKGMQGPVKYAAATNKSRHCIPARPR